MKYKVGDKVRYTALSVNIINNSSFEILKPYINKTGTIIKKEMYDAYTILFDDNDMIVMHETAIYKVKLTRIFIGL